MAKRTNSRKILIIEDDKDQEDPDELNPFSFKEFIRSKNLSSLCSGGTEEQNSVLALKKTGSESAMVAGEDCPSLKHCAPPPFLLSTDYDERKEGKGSYEPPAIQDMRDFVLCGTLVNECIDPPRASAEEDSDAKVLTQQDRGYLHEACEPMWSPATHDRDQDQAPLDDISYQTKQCCTMIGSRDQQKLREENEQLRNHVKALLKKSDSDNQRIRELIEQLHKQKVTEESEAQALETMVQSVEQNLQKMTKRAVKAETNASKLKQELLQVRDQLEVYRSENERLRAAETTALTTMKQNARVASEYLSKAANNAQTSISQLLSEAETLTLVSKMLCSIDKLSEMHPEDW